MLLLKHHDKLRQVVSVWFVPVLEGDDDNVLETEEAGDDDVESPLDWPVWTVDLVRFLHTRLLLEEVEISSAYESQPMQMLLSVCHLTHFHPRLRNVACRFNNHVPADDVEKCHAELADNWTLQVQGCTEFFFQRRDA